MWGMLVTFFGVSGVVLFHRVARFPPFQPQHNSQVSQLTADKFLIVYYGNILQQTREDV
jgi:hypothetical protein